MNLLLKFSTQSKVCGRVECKCCAGWRSTGQGVKARRRAVKRRERQQWKREVGV